MMKIWVKGRSLLHDGAPLGMQNDSGVEKVEFILEKGEEPLPLSQGIACLSFCRADGFQGMVPLKKQEGAGGTALLWQVSNETTCVPGLLRVQLVVSGLDARLWHSEVVSLQIGEGIAGEDGQIIPLEPLEAEKRPSITVVERRLQIPSVYQKIAVRNDENSQSVLIRLPRYYGGVDLSGYEIFLKTISSGGRDDLHLANPTVTDGEIHCVWTLAPPQTSYAGILRLQISIKGEDFQWESQPGQVEIVESLDAGPVNPEAPTVLDKILSQALAAAAQASAASTAAQQWAQKSEQAASHGPVIGEDGCWQLWDGELGAYVSSGVLAEADFDRADFQVDETTGRLMLDLDLDEEE